MSRVSCTARIEYGDKLKALAQRTLSEDTTALALLCSLLARVIGRSERIILEHREGIIGRKGLFGGAIA